jgi:hypothetical protein
MYGGASWALSPERASANVKMEKNLGQNTRGHRYITVPDTSRFTHTKKYNFNLLHTDLLSVTVTVTVTLFHIISCILLIVDSSYLTC